VSSNFFGTFSRTAWVNSVSTQTGGSNFASIGGSNSESVKEEKAFDDAALHVRKFCTMFGDPVDTKYTSGDDRPLPYELKIRGNRSAGGGQQRRSW